MAGWFRTGVVSPGPAAYCIRRDFDPVGNRTESGLSFLTSPTLSSRVMTANPLKRSYSPVSTVQSIENPSIYKEVSSKRGIKGSSFQLEAYRSISPPAKEIALSRNAHNSPIQIVYDVTPHRQTCSRAASPFHHSGSLTIPHIRSQSPLQTPRFVLNPQSGTDTRSQKSRTDPSTSPIRFPKPCRGPAFSIKGRETMWQEAWGAMLVRSS